MWDSLRLDVRHSFRSLRRAPTFSLIVVVTLTLAVGATTAVGSLLNAVVLRTLAVPLMQERFTATLATFAAALTILVTCIGVYALLVYSVTARVREIGVRLALGAERRMIVWMIVRDGLAIAVPGVLIGAASAWAAARLVRAQLYGIAPRDPGTLLIAAAMFIGTVLAASLVPALRASRVAPAEALCEE